jgi:hypothetical protein
LQHTHAYPVEASAPGSLQTYRTTRRPVWLDGVPLKINPVKAIPSPVPLNRGDCRKNPGINPQGNADRCEERLGRPKVGHVVSASKSWRLFMSTDVELLLSTLSFLTYHGLQLFGTQKRISHPVPRIWYPVGARTGSPTCSIPQRTHLFDI